MYEAFLTLQQDIELLFLARAALSQENLSLHHNQAEQGEEQCMHYLKLNFKYLTLIQYTILLKSLQAKNKETTRTSETCRFSVFEYCLTKDLFTKQI